MSDVPSPEQLAEYQRLAEVATAVQRAYQRGFEDGRRAVSTPAAEPTGDTGAPGGDELREQIAEAVATAGEGYWARADAVLALPAVRDALAAQETVTAIRELHACDATEPHACDYCGQAWPCDVIHALDTRGEPE
jgi:hypothetical protein